MRKQIQIQRRIMFRKVTVPELSEHELSDFEQAVIAIKRQLKGFINEIKIDGIYSGSFRLFYVVKPESRVNSCVIRFSKKSIHNGILEVMANEIIPYTDFIEDHEGETPVISRFEIVEVLDLELH